MIPELPKLLDLFLEQFKTCFEIGMGIGNGVQIYGAEPLFKYLVQ